MAKEVTAYIAKDGSIHLEKAAADLIDKACDLKEDIDDFIKSINADDKDGCFRRMIIRWEQYRGTDASVVKPVAAVPVEKPKHEVILIRASDIKPKAYKRKVGIVGVWSGNQTSIKKDFGDKLDLYIYSPDDVNKLQGAKELQKIFVMRKFVSHRHTDILRSIGQEPMLINGGMGELKDALTAFVNAA